MAFAEVYHAYFEFVWRSLRRLGVREDDAADAAQEVFLVVYRKLAEFEGRAKMTTWLYGICLRVAGARRRRAHERREIVGEHAVPEVADPSADVGAEAERREGLGMLDGVLDEMSLEQRSVFTLFELDEMTGDQIAELLGVPLGTVYSRLRLARASFRQSLTRLQARDRRQLATAEGGAR